MVALRTAVTPLVTGATCVHPARGATTSVHNVSTHQHQTTHTTSPARGSTQFIALLCQYMLRQPCIWPQGTAQCPCMEVWYSGAGWNRPEQSEGCTSWVCIVVAPIVVCIVVTPAPCPNSHHTHTHHTANPFSRNPSWWNSPIH